MTMKEEEIVHVQTNGDIHQKNFPNLRWRRSILSLAHNSIFVMLGNLKQVMIFIASHSYQLGWSSLGMGLEWFGYETRVVWDKTRGSLDTRLGGLK